MCIFREMNSISNFRNTSESEQFKVHMYYCPHVWLMVVGFSDAEVLFRFSRINVFQTKRCYERKKQNTEQVGQHRMSYECQLKKKLYVTVYYNIPYIICFYSSKIPLGLPIGMVLIYGSHVMVTKVWSFMITLKYSTLYRDRYIHHAGTISLQPVEFRK